MENLRLLIRLCRFLTCPRAFGESARAVKFSNEEMDEIESLFEVRSQLREVIGSDEYFFCLLSITFSTSSEQSLALR